MDILSADNYVMARMIFDRTLGAIYFIAFLSAYNQFPALLGEHGLLPVPDFVKRVKFRQFPTVFHWKYSDSMLKIMCGVGMLLGLLLTFGAFDYAPIVVHMLSWLTLYGLYLSLVSVGQDFYGFGWETMLLEAGFFAAFMGPYWVTPSWIPILILRWMLYRTEMGAGLIKLRGDQCWRDLTCLYYHHETQPLPNPLSRYFHHLPKWFHRFGVVFSHFCQLVAPFGLFFPQPIAAVAGFFLIFHQMILVVSGNYSWLNWLTIVLGVLAFSDGGIATTPAPLWFQIIQIGIGVLAIFLSYRPFLNFFQKRQYMNYCWNRWHLVGAYGAFGSVTKERYEIVIEGTDEISPDEKTVWKEYGFRGKPVELNRTPPVVAPYHLRLDWMIWFLPFGVLVGDDDIYVQGHDLWFVRFMLKLLRNDKRLLKLLRHNPFPDDPPVWVRAKFYQYHFTESGEKNIWKRTYKGEYCPELSLKSLPGLV
ncbi:lipase maturation factor family protein [Peredibacter starrii]|uniref:Lipase maturation factor family protein n=1 Tax=Peredibacter starrii TaxID=28202 RepID=A0AAX4HUF1_9BACT|nr:lipase maturation factor family protein [Peredibacter starrii]WPU66929.1 lipase maturation factor family protein [Peredibacter starrii]